MSPVGHDSLSSPHALSFMAEAQVKPKVKRVVFSKEPARIHVFKQSTQPSTPSATHDAPSTLPFFQTDVKIYLQSTGDDNGDRAAIRGYLSFPGDYTALQRELPVLHSFETENLGLGRLLVDRTHYSCGLPASFAAVVYEDNARGEAYVLSNAIDWTEPANAQYADGGAWVWKSWNSADSRYVANLWVQVKVGW